MTHIEAMKQALEAFCFMPNEIVTQSGVQVAMSSLRQAIAEAEGQEKALQSLHAENERLGLYKDAYGKPVIDKSAAIRIATALGWEPKRTLVGLTDEEKHKTWYEMQNIMGWYSFQEIARAIEAKLKDKNGYAEENT